MLSVALGDSIQLTVHYVIIVIIIIIIIIITACTQTQCVVQLDICSN